MSYQYLAIDFGQSYVGFSVSNGYLTKPLDVFKYPQGNYQVLRNHLFKIIEKYNPSFVVIGVPLSNVNSTLKIKEIFLSLIFKDTEIEKKIVWFNEDYSTKKAILLKKRKRMREDSIAASIILENYFASIELNREVRIYE